MSKYVKGLIFLSLLGALSCAHWPLQSKRGETPEIETLSPQAKADLHYLKSKLYYLNVDANLGLVELKKAANLSPHPFLNFELAEAYLQAGKLDEAQEAILEVLKTITPETQFESMDVHELAAEIFERRGEYEKALEQYRAVLKVDPSQENIWLNLSRIYNRLHDVPQALALLKDLLRQYPDNENANFYVGLLHLKQGDLPQAKNLLEKAIKIQPDFVQALRYLAQIYEQEKNYPQALKFYRRLLDYRQLDEQASGRVLQIYLQQNKPKLAIAHLLEMESLEPDNIQTKLNLGKLYFEENRYDDAIAVFKSILVIKPDYHAVRFYLGVVLEELNRNNDAIAAFAEIPEDSGIYLESVLHLAYLFQIQGQTLKSIDLLKTAITLRTESPDLRDLLASGFENLGKIDLAIGVLENALVQFKKHERINYHLGSLYDQANRKDECIAQMKKVIEINPEHANALNYLGYTYTEENTQLDEAEHLIKRALAIRPEDGFIHDSLGWLYYRQGHYDKAIATLKRALELTPDEPTVLEHLADSYLQTGKIEKAKSSYQLAIKLNEKRPPSDQRDSEIARLRVKIKNLSSPKTATDSQLPLTGR